MTDGKKVRIIIWRIRLALANGGPIGILLVAAIAFSVLHKVPVGPTREIVAQVNAIGVTHGPTGGGRYLVCTIDSGVQVRVFLDAAAPLIQKGQMVKLSMSSHWLLGGKTYKLLNIDMPDS